MALNDRLTMLRKNNKYTTRELAEKLDVSPSSVSLWEKGERKPDYKKIIQISKLYGVSTDYLLGSEDNSDDSIIQELNARRNNLDLQISKFKHSSLKLKKELEQIEHSLQIDLNYRDNLAHQGKNLNKLKDDDLKLYSILNERIDEKNKQLEMINRNNACIQENIKNLQYEAEKVYNLYKNEVENEFIQSSKIYYFKKDKLDKLNINNFNELRITSEYDLQIIILKYLGIFDFDKDSKIDVKELIDKLRSTIENYFPRF